MIMKNKRGQFYIIAAIIIVTILIGSTSIVSYAKLSKKPRTIESLDKELNEEGSRIVSYGISNSRDINVLLDNFTTSEFAPYFLEKTEGTNIIFVYGNASNLSAVKYNTKSTGTISANIGSGSPTWTPTSIFAERIQVTPSDPLVVNVTLGSGIKREYEFKLRNDNEMFYFVIIQEKEGEVFVQGN